MNYFEKKYKDCSPTKTVERIIEILKENDIEVEEKWGESNELGTFSVRVYVKGSTRIGTNGKGTTREYARASAYGEFMERIENMIFSSSQNMPFFKFDSHNHIFALGEKLLTAEEIIDENNAYIQMYMENRGLSKASRLEKINAFKKLERMDYYVFKEHNRYLCVPFFSVAEKKYVYLPLFSYRAHYGSNGMSAGNTSEEALVQALSEILERIVNRKAIYNSVSFPNIPDEYIESNYPEIYEYMRKIKSDGKLNVIVKDCSCGGRYPVVAVIFIKKNTRFYGVKFGAHPNQRIALERCFTEATQGQSLERFAQRSFLDFSNENVFCDNNLLKGYRTGDCKYDYKVISDKPTYQYCKAKNVDAKSNSEILKEMMKGILEDNKDILIRDVSYLGFPAYHVIVPTMSEVERKSDVDIDKFHYNYLSRKLVLDVKRINDENIDKVLNTLSGLANKLGTGSLTDLIGMDYPYPAHEYQMDAIYLYAMCCFASGNINAAEHAMKLICDHKPMGEGAIYDAIYDYFVGTKMKMQHNSIMKYLRAFYDKNICDKIDDIFADAKATLIKQYPKIEEESEVYRKNAPDLLITEKIYKKYVAGIDSLNENFLDNIVNLLEKLSI